MSDFEVKKVRKKNCSEVRIYNRNSDLVKKENEVRRIRVKRKTYFKKEKTELEKRNEVYKKTVQQIEILHFNSRINSAQRKLIKKLVFKFHRNQKLYKTTYRNLLRSIRNFEMFKLQKLLRA